MIELTNLGEDIFKKHKKANDESYLPIFEELKKYPDDKIDFLIASFKWIDEYLELSRKKMEEHAKGLK